MALAFSESTNKTKSRSGSNNNHWKGGAPKCINCANKLAARYSNRSSLYCNDCRGLAVSKEKHPNWKGGLTEQQKAEKKAGRARPESCELCGSIGKICFDHDHNTGEFRGWICWRCNIVLGHVRDNSELLMEMVKYLASNQKTI